MRRRGGRLAVVECDGVTRGRVVDQHEPSPAQARADRVGHRDGELDRDRRVDGVPAAPQDFRTDFRGLALGSRDGPTLEGRFGNLDGPTRDLGREHQRQTDGDGAGHAARPP